MIRRLFEAWWRPHVWTPEWRLTRGWVLRCAASYAVAAITGALLSLAFAFCAHAQILGAFVPFGSSACSQEPNLVGMGAWLGRPKSSMPLPTYPPGATWAALAVDFQGFSNLAAARYSCNSKRPYIWAIPLTMWGTPLSAVTSGSYDSTFRLVAQQIALYQPHAIIRLGWEMNGPWYAWGVNQQGSPAQFVAAFRHVAPIFRKLGLKIDWNVAPCSINWCRTPTTKFWPGRTYVDYIGMDIYDWPNGGTTEQSHWQARLNDPYGLRWHIGFAAQQSRPASYPEWGLHEVDSGYFIRQMSAWIKINRVAYSNYWDTDSATVVSQIYPVNPGTPIAAAAFLKAWGR